MSAATRDAAVIDERTQLVPGKPVVDVRGLGRAFAGRSVLQGIDLQVDAGEIVALIGRSGSGKSTLLRILAGLDAEFTGNAEVNGRVAVAFQDARLLPWRRVRENVALGLRNDARNAVAEKELREVGLGDHLRSWPLTLSGGEAQRVSLARALVRDPNLMLLDEPFGALDAFTREELWAVLRDLWATQRFTVILVTHDLTEAVYLADKVHVCSKRPGRIVTSRTVDLPHPRDKYAPEFVALVRELHNGIAKVRAS
jgi:ABC-type nitrate/sulfonate/bicarbonate transport system ATPase subunit